VPENCPICETALRNLQRPAVTTRGDTLDATKYDCPRCGEFVLTGTLEAMLSSLLARGIYRRALMSHKLRRMAPPSGALETISSYTIERLLAEENLPTPPEQADELILWVGDHQLSHDYPTQAALYYLGAWVGTSLFDQEDPHSGIRWLLSHLADFTHTLAPLEFPDSGTVKLQFTMGGWEKYAELKKAKVESRIAFMAMKFNEPVVDAVVKDCFKPAVARAGFELRLLTDQQKAGLIDNHLRAALLASRFTIADLSHGSHGAYWEAGFAEGLARPVFYTCNATAWNEQKPHFDTNHLLTIIWDESNLKKAGDELTAAIRATLRDEAKQND
jgi:hypothetical protein